MTAPAQHRITSELDFDIILKVGRPGDRMAYKDRFGVVRTGRVQISPALSGRAHFVIDAGGKHGTPVVVSATNFDALKPAVDRREAVDERIRTLIADRQASLAAGAGAPETDAPAPRRAPSPV